MSDRKLFKVSVPWYVRVWGAFRAWRRNRKIVAAALAEKRRFKHVATVEQKTTWMDAGYHSHEYYTLWENGLGKRRYDYRSDNWLLDKPEATKVFNHIVQPWLTGRVSTSQVRDFERRQNA